MKKVEVGIEVITPMFSHGSDTKNIEFRITELKALMRTTYREIYYLNKINVGEKFELFDMKKCEAELFGSQGLRIDSEKEIKACKSPISFCLKDIDIKNMKNCSKKKDCKQNDKCNEFCHKYILPRYEKSKVLLPCLGMETKIKLMLYIKEEKNVELYINLLILSSILGGMGQASRNGMGSFRISNIDCEGNEIYDGLLKKSPEEILEVILGKDWKTGLNKLEGNKKDENIGYPFLRAITILTIDENHNIESKLKGISELNHHMCESIHKIKGCDWNILGVSDNKNRFASPIYTTFWENNSQLYMIVKELNYDYFIKEFDRNSEVVKIYIDELKKVASSKGKVDFRDLKERLEVIISECNKGRIRNNNANV